ncbi:MAG: sigma-70 family RNA polymerase sigma factor [Dysgonamonadaceae bacterium]
MLNKTEFKSLFDEYFDAIRSFVFYRCGNEETASDIAQEVFMKVWEKREHWVCDNMKALLYKMAGDLFISNVRKEQIRCDFESGIVQEDTSILSPEELMLHQEMNFAYARALAEMPELQRVVFLMSRNDNLNYKEIAVRLHIGVKAVEKRMSGALQFLRNEFLATENERRQN